MDIKKAEEKVIQIDSLLTTITKLIKKHWLILLFIALGAGIYFVWNMSDESDQQDTEEVETNQ